MTWRRLNDRQGTWLNRLLDGFEGKLTNAKWVDLIATSPDAALRDINALTK